MSERPRRREAVLVDALGTLIELQPPAPKLRGALQRRSGIVVSEREAERAIAAEIAYYRAHMAEGRDPEALAGLRRRCAAALRDALPEGSRPSELDPVLAALLDSLEFRAFEDARAALVAVREAGVRLVVVSNWDVALAEVLTRVGLAQLLDGVVVSAVVGAAKPRREIFELALSIAGVRPSGAVHVGDSLSDDVQGARGAGIEPVLLRRDGLPGPAGVTTIASLAELPSLL